MDGTDGDLVRHARAGDAAAFDALVDRHYAGCLRFAWRQLGNRADAEEAVQDAFVRAYRSLARCTSPDRFRAWLMTIVVNRCRSRAARDRRRFAVLDRLRHTAAEPVTATESDPFLEARLTAALRQLSPALREAFLLKHVEQLSYEEIAAVTGARISALKMRVKRAGDALVELLEGSNE